MQLLKEIFNWPEYPKVDFIMVFSMLIFVFLIKEDGKMDFEIDQHQIGVFPTLEVEKILEKIGFENHIYSGFNELTWDEESGERPVFVCVK